MQTSWARFRRQEGLSQGWMPLPGKHCCCLKHLFPLGIPAGATRWQSCEAKDPRAGRLESESPQAEITAKFTFWQLWSLKAKETSSLSKTIPLLQPGPYHLNKPGIPLPIKLLWTSIYLSTYPSIYTPIHTSNLLNIYENVVCTRHCAQHWRYSSEQTDPEFTLSELTSYWGKVNIKPMTTQINRPLQPRAVVREGLMLPKGPDCSDECGNRERWGGRETSRGREKKM